MSSLVWVSCPYTSVQCLTDPDVLSIIWVSVWVVKSQEVATLATVLHLPLDRDGPEPLYRQIAAALRERMVRGELTVGERLPPVRALALSLGVTPETAAAAYKELERAGAVTARVGRGTFVAAAAALPPPVAGTPVPLPFSAAGASTEYADSPQHVLFDDILRLASQAGMVAFMGGVPAPDLLPVEQVRRAIDRVLRRDGAAALQYDAPEGYLPLRRTVARFLEQEGIDADPDGMLITSGVMQGIDLVAKVFVNPGDDVVTESPTYLPSIGAFKTRGARILPVPLDGEGLDLLALERLLVRHRPKLIYTMPSFQNPTGQTMSIEKRLQLLAIAQRFDIPVLEDDYCSLLHYTPRPPVALKALDRSGHVIYLASVSKVISPGLRLGYLLAAPSLLPRLKVAKYQSDMHTPSLIQRAVDLLLKHPETGAHLQRLRAEYRGRRDAILAAMAAHFPAGVSWTRPEGGFHLWVRVPPHVPVMSLFFEATRRGVAFAPGQVFFPGEATENGLRLSFSATSVEAINQGIPVLGELLAAYLARPPQLPAPGSNP